MTYFFAPVARTFAIASLTGAALLAGSVAPTWAQTADSKDSKTPPAAAAATSTKPETVEQRIVTLKTALKITPDQEPKWTAVAQAMRDSSVQMEKLVATKRAIPPEKTTAVDDLKTYQEFTEVRLDGPEEGELEPSSRSTTRCRPSRRRTPTWCSRSTARRSPRRRARRSIMTSSKRIGLAASLVLGMLSVAAMTAPASAAWWGNGQWNPDNRWNDNRNNNRTTTTGTTGTTATTTASRRPSTRRRTTTATSRRRSSTTTRPASRSASSSGRKRETAGSDARRFFVLRPATESCQDCGRCAL